MRLLSCRIDGFGKLRDHTLDIGENPLILFEKNGWGKSTLAAFLRVMFYGFENETKKKTERERDLWRPWSPVENYGGKLRFLYEEKEYQLSRSFGKKPAEDTMEVLDLSTNLRTEEFGEVPGQVIFGLDAESFRMTFYVEQNGTASSATDGIHAMMGDLGGLDDIDKLGKTLDTFKEKQNALSDTRSTGAIKKMKGELTALQQNVTDQAAVTAHLAGLMAQQENIREQIREKTGELEESRKQYARQGEDKELGEAVHRYEDLKSGYDQEVKAFRAEEAFFGGSVPGEEELAAAEEGKKEYTRYYTRYEEQKLSPEEEKELAELRRLYPAGFPEEEALEQAREAAADLEQLRERILRESMRERDRVRLEELKQYFEKEDAVKKYFRILQGQDNLRQISRRGDAARRHLEKIEDDIANVDEKEETLKRQWEMEKGRARVRYEQELARIEEDEGRRKEEYEKQRRWRIPTMIISYAIGALLLVAAIVLFLMGAGILGVVLSAIGSVAFLVLGGIFTLSFINCVRVENYAAGETERKKENASGNLEVPLPVGLEEGSYLEEKRQGLEEEKGAALKEVEEYGNRYREACEAIEDGLAYIGYREEETSGYSVAYPLLQDREVYEDLREEELSQEEAWAAQIEVLNKAYGEYDKLSKAAKVYEEKDLEARQEACRNKWQEIMGPFSQDTSENPLQLLSRLGEEGRTFRRLADREELAGKARQEAEKNYEIFRKLMQPYWDMHGYSEEDGELLEEVKRHRLLYFDLKERMESRQKALEEFEGQQDMDRLLAYMENRKSAEESEAPEKIDVPADMAALKESITGLEEEIWNLRERRSALEEQVEEAAGRLDQIDTDKEKIEELEKKKARYDHRLEIYRKTADYLNKAKEDYLSSYIQPLQQAYERHYRHMSDTMEAYRINVKLQVSREEAGMERNVERLSQGYRDLCYLALRLAMIDVMYEGKDKPFLILDDPFVNLDGDKIPMALNYLNTLAGDYQLLYMTCHESRT